jgi:hypothetical protein
MAHTREMTELTNLTDFYDSTFDKRGRYVDYILIAGFAFVLLAQAYIHYGPKFGGDYEKSPGFVGPPRPTALFKS